MFPSYIIFLVPITYKLNFCRKNTPTFQCSFCDKKIGGQSNLNSHIKAKHTKIGGPETLDNNEDGQSLDHSQELHENGQPLELEPVPGQPAKK
jgi:hypothetical protein